MPLQLTRQNCQVTQSHLDKKLMEETRKFMVMVITGNGMKNKLNA